MNIDRFWNFIKILVSKYIAIWPISHLREFVDKRLESDSLPKVNWMKKVKREFILKNSKNVKFSLEIAKKEKNELFSKEILLDLFL